MTPFGDAPARLDREAQATATPPSFAQVYDEHFDFLWRAARRLGVREANLEDCVQDVFLVLHRKMADYDPKLPMRRFLLGIVTRVASDHRRRFRRKDQKLDALAGPDGSEERFASQLPAPHEQLERAEEVQLVEDLLGELDDEKREVLVLTQLEELTVPEVADMIHVNVNTVYTRLRAARRAFEEAYERRVHPEGSRA